MKGLGDNRSRHLSDNLDSPQDSLYATQDRNPYLLSPTDSYTMEPRFPAPNSLHSDCLLPLNNQISNSSTFPRIHYNSHFEVPDENPFPSHAQATKINRLPANLLDQFEKQLPIHRDGFSTLQFQRSSDVKHRSESPGRIRHLVHSVQKLFAKSQSLEGASKGSMNGKKGAEDSKQNRRSKSKDRAKTTETKRRTRSNISGWWSSDDNLDSDTCNYRNPMGLMTLGRQPDHSQPRYFMHAYNTISEHMLKSSKSNNDLKVTPCPNIPISSESNYIKRGSWSTLTLSHAREMCQKASATIDRALLKSKSCHQDLAYQYLQAISDSDHFEILYVCMTAEKRDDQGSACLVGYKKTPPPVPPRTTSKPFISVTVQSSTESAQDNYLDNQDHKSEVNSQSGLSNSSDSLDSTRPPSVTKGSIATPVREPPELPQKNAALKSDKGTLTNEEPKVENIPKRKLSSIGIQSAWPPVLEKFEFRTVSRHLKKLSTGDMQWASLLSLRRTLHAADTGLLGHSRCGRPLQVDCLQPVAKEEPPPSATKFQSIGVQVEDEWRNSHSHSMSTKQDTDSDSQEPNNSTCKSSERSLADCPPCNNNSLDANTRQTAMPSQIKKNLSYGDSNDPALEPSSLPPPDPWLETSTNTPSEPTQPGACRRDGYWFQKLLQAETERLEGWCRQMDQETKENNLSEEVLGKVLSAVGSAQLLMSQKFQQFRGLCDQNLNPNSNPRPTAQDLAGFWDLLQLSIEDISMKFDELYHLKANGWQLIETPEKKEEKKVPPPVPKKPAKPKSQLNRDKASDSVDKQRQEARKRLMAAKRAASVRQNSATESADSIEIYVPEAQTRL
ncbi:hypothetical protein lerEdw1_016919 [Lerista edwardsae]|nr:hypothetical protein lerEdw1_016919 [Lerista edwardsae]